MKNRRRYQIEVLEVVLASAIIVLSVILFFNSRELTVLFPIEFGLASVLSVLYALEGILYNRNRVVKKTRLILFGLIAAVLLFFAVISAITIAR